MNGEQWTMTSSSPAVTRAYSSLLASLSDAAQQLAAEFESMSDEDFLESKSASSFVLGWMRDHFRFQKQFDALINRNVMQPSADQFTAVVALALGQYLAVHGFAGAVKSEVAVAPRRGMPRPDISVWRADATLAAVIECKTNLGYNRDGWQRQYDERTKQFLTCSNGCLSYLLVLTRQNWLASWSLFEASELRHVKWFCLTGAWPSDVGEPVTDFVLDPIEPMFASIKNCLALDRAAVKAS